MLAAQTVLMFLYANFVVFNVLGRNYDAAVMTTGFCGFGMGATPNAMANMQAVVGQYGPAPTAFMVVPLVGSLFIDFLKRYDPDRIHQLLRLIQYPYTNTQPVLWAGCLLLGSSAAGRFSHSRQALIQAQDACYYVI